jgi:hypothetical protein
MPKGPDGRKRPADAIGRAVMVAQIATGEIEDQRPKGEAAVPEKSSRAPRHKDRERGG